MSPFASSRRTVSAGESDSAASGFFDRRNDDSYTFARIDARIDEGSSGKGSMISRIATPPSHAVSAVDRKADAGWPWF